MKRASRTWYGTKLPSEKLLQRLIAEVGNPPFDREKVFAEVDASNRRFDKFTDKQRKKLREAASLIRERAKIKKSRKKV
jgi:hypothetical protein